MYAIMMRQFASADNVVGSITKLINVGSG